ncbi:hypothetical protein AWH56_005120 [Anaerobacillus isosaccharinicus]|uniref:Uncharacterized protein n=1 Tax=Anaerobacillus isosaccharinicus TaxID=1532552 RepID=A0A1S2L944_9BACI|nr:hypothetical protein [Anaerobacillus isosaccharinicus]MBA5584592.1 hypothetical protein [Anaerobacillus isosaccharinicus]QOY37029.1 hypothetical protein AWH56_005120 [Anaerobacillus isosaccharinicus]
MRYKFLYYEIVRGEKLITVLDFQEARTIRFDLEALQSDQLEEDLKAYMRTIWKSHVMNSQFEYKSK